jgi:predicted lactoylglutathione lyase
MTKTIFISLPVTDLAASTSSGSMLSLAMDSRDAVDAMNRAAAAHGGQADANPAEDFGYMYSRDLADPDGHLWATFWMAPPAERDGGTPAAATFATTNVDLPPRRSRPRISATP